MLVQNDDRLEKEKKRTRVGICCMPVPLFISFTKPFRFEWFIALFYKSPGQKKMVEIRCIHQPAVELSALQACG